MFTMFKKVFSVILSKYRYAISLYLGDLEMYLETNRLMIRKFEIDDIQAVLEYTSDHGVMEYIPEGVFTKKMRPILLVKIWGMMPGNLLLF